MLNIAKTTFTYRFSILKNTALRGVVLWVSSQIIAFIFVDFTNQQQC